MWLENKYDITSIEFMGLKVGREGKRKRRS